MTRALNWPGRLAEDPEFDAMMQTASEETFSQQRLDSVAVSIEGGLNASPAATVAGSIGAKLGTILLASGLTGAGIFALWLDKPEPKSQLEPMPVLAAPAPGPLPPMVIRSVGVEKPTKRAVKPKRRKEKQLVASSQLAEQLRLYREAQELAKQEQHKDALRLLQQLLDRFPQSPLQPEIEISRVEILIKDDQEAEAIAHLKKMLPARHHQGKRAMLYFTLADLLRKRGDCPAALAAYQSAQSAGLAEKYQDSPERFINACRRTEHAFRSTDP